MTELFDDDEDEESLIDDESCMDDEIVELEVKEEVMTLDARRRLDHWLEQRRLRKELDDFSD